MKCLAIGGCHMEGYPIGYENSFIYNFTKSFASETLVEGHFPLSQTRRIAELIREHQPDLVVLQLGNYEFDASIKKTIFLWKKRFFGPGWQKQEDGQAKKTKRARWAVSKMQSVKSNPVFSLLQWLFLFPTCLIRMCLVADSVHLLKEVTRQFPMVKFIMLTPLPVERAVDNCVRKRAGRYFKARFRKHANVSIVDTHDVLKRPQVFADPSHLNMIGHILLQNALEQKIL